MRACNFCGCEFDDKTAACPNCGSTTFAHVCPNCSNIFEGAYCTECGVRYDEPARTCPNCGTVYYTDDCPNCGQDMIEARAKARAQARAQSNTGSGNYGQDPASQAGKGNLPLLAVVMASLGMMTCMFPFSIIGLVLAVRAENAGTKNTMTKTAKILSIVGIITGLIILAGMGSAGNSN